MAEEIAILSRDQVRALNLDWKDLQESFSPLHVTPQSHGRAASTVSTLCVLSGRRELWELVVSSAGYISERLPQHITRPSGVLTLPRVVRAAADQTWQQVYAGYQEYVADVTTMDFERVIAAAPSAAYGIKLGNLKLQTFSCINYCQRTYPDKREKLLECLRQCK